MDEIRTNTAVDDFLDTLRYPVTKGDVLAKARPSGLPPEAIEAFGRIPDAEYASAEELTQALNAG
jgi:hypothetical protein